MDDAQNQPPKPSRLRAMGRAFADRNYRLFFAGQGVSLVGTWMSRLATGWLVFRLGGADAACLLGAVSFAGLAPTFFLAPLGSRPVPRVSDDPRRYNRVSGSRASAGVGEPDAFF